MANPCGHGRGRRGHGRVAVLGTYSRPAVVPGRVFSRVRCLSWHVAEEFPAGAGQEPTELRFGHPDDTEAASILHGLCQTLGSH